MHEAFNQMIRTIQAMLLIHHFRFHATQEEDWFEISHSSIREIGREIGKGAFGRVFVARIADIPGKLDSQIVAIKKLKSKFNFGFYLLPEGS